MCKSAIDKLKTGAWLWGFGALIGVTSPVGAATPLHQQIDQLIESQAGGPLAGEAGDAEFLRRICLDLNGIIPTADEVRQFVADQDAQKRVKKIDSLLASPLYARRLREAFTAMLLERRTGAAVPVEQWNEFLESSFSTNKPWNQFVQELLKADANQAKTKGAVKFFSVSGRADHDQLTRDVARLLLGMDIQCAKCHDHPDVEQYKQADYFGLLAYLQQTKTAKHPTSKQTLLTETVAKGKSEFESVFDPGNKHATGPKLPDGVEIEIPTFEAGQEFAQPAKDGLPPIAKFRPRQLLAEHLTAANHQRFATNAVNRFWYLMMGRGLIQPLDLIHDENPASHPQLLELLTKEFIEHQYDVQWFLRELAMTRTYQRSSRLPDGAESQDIAAASYQVATPKGLSPEQTAWSVMRATGVLENLVSSPATADSKFTFKDYINGRVPAPQNFLDTMSLFISIFANPPGEPEVEFQPSMGQALFLMNEPLVLGWLKPTNGNLVDRLQQETNLQLVSEKLYLNILSRLPNDEESADVVTFLEQHEDRAAAIGQYAWAMLASAEFRLNH